MRLYSDGRLTAAAATHEDAREALARLKGARKGRLRLEDGERSFSLTREGVGLFLEVADGMKLAYGIFIPDHEAGGALSAFLKGDLPLPGGLPVGGPGLASIVLGDPYHPDCPLCRMLGGGGA